MAIIADSLIGSVHSATSPNHRPAETDQHPYERVTFEVWQRALAESEAVINHVAEQTALADLIGPIRSCRFFEVWACGLFFRLRIGWQVGGDA